MAPMPAPGRHGALPTLGTVAECVELILEQFHTPLLRDLARLHVSLREARKLFAAESAPLEGLLAAFAAYREHTETHLFKEEQVLFPAFLEGHRGSGAPVGSVYVMQREHVHEEEQLAALLSLAEACGVPAEAPEAWIGLREELKILVASQRQHARIEDEVLVPLVMGR